MGAGPWLYVLRMLPIDYADPCVGLGWVGLFVFSSSCSRLTILFKAKALVRRDRFRVRASPTVVTDMFLWMLEHKAQSQAPVASSLL